MKQTLVNKSGIRTIARIDTIPKDTIPKDTIPKDTIPNGHNPEWTLSRMSTYLVTEELFHASLVRSFYKDAFDEKLLLYNADALNNYIVMSQLSIPCS